MAVINTIHGPVDESLLQLHRNVKEDAVYKITVKEYCVKGCKGQAHHTGKPDAPEFFCHMNVHRSVDSRMKTWPHGMGILSNL